MEITFENCKFDINEIIELMKKNENKVVSLSKENGWLKIGEYVETKYFVNNSPTSSGFRTIIRELTDKEFQIYECGDSIGGLIDVCGQGFAIYRNYKTKEEKRIVIHFG